MQNINLKDLLSGNKFLPIYLDRKNQPRNNLSPVAVELHWTSVCNYNCIHCSYGKRRQKQNKLSLNIVSSLAEDLIDLKISAVYLSGGGEPTTFDGWQGYVKQFLDNGIEVALITNGINIKEKDIEIVGKMNYVANSIYSANEEIYKKITGSSFFDRQFALPKMLGKVNSQTIVGARCVLNNLNYDQVVKIYERAIDTGFNYIIFIPAVDYENTGVSLGDYNIECIKKLLAENYGLFDLKRTNIDSLISRNIDYYERKNYLDLFKVTPKLCCAVDIRGNAFVNYDGGVYLCQPHIGNKKYCIGNLNELKFSEIWNSERHLDIIDILHKNFSLGLCKNCRSINFNKIVDEFDANNVQIDISSIKYDPFI